MPDGKYGCLSAIGNVRFQTDSSYVVAGSQVKIISLQVWGETYLLSWIVSATYNFVMNKYVREHGSDDLNHYGFLGENNKMEA